jgi:2-C-methyl-D-erythritol 4-phosphate cytidylyltransferase
MNRLTVNLILIAEDKSLAESTIEVFSTLKELHEILVICPEEIKNLFEEGLKGHTLRFSEIADNRQLTIQKALKVMKGHPQLVCIFDADAYCPSIEQIRRVLFSAYKYGASALGAFVPLSLRECDDQGFLIKTLDNKSLYEIGPLQVIKTSLLKEGMDLAIRHGIEAPDEISYVELTGEPVQIIDDEAIDIASPKDVGLMQEMLSKFNIKS